MTQDRKLVTCVNGHRSSVPTDALLGEQGSAYRCPKCGLGIPGPDEREIGSDYWFARQIEDRANKATNREDEVFWSMVQDALSLARREGEGVREDRSRVYP